jgi:hypothetical protein
MATTPHTYYSQRTGQNPHPDGLPLFDIVGLFVRVYDHLCDEGYFAEAFGYECVDAGSVPGSVKDVQLRLLLAVRKKNLWPIHEHSLRYTEDDLFDVIEYLFQVVSKPIDGTFHNWNGCGMHWETFNKRDGQRYFCSKVNEVLEHYVGKFELSASGEILQKAEAGFEQKFAADVPSKDANIVDRVNGAVKRYRRHGSTVDERRLAVRDLSDVLEYLRPKVKSLITAKDEDDLFNLANNFGIRHHNDQQKTAYDAGLWLSWMFYFYLATIHVVLRKLQQSTK